MPYHTHASRDILKLDEIHQFIKDNFVAAGYGGLRLDAPTPLADLDITWQQVPFGVAIVPNPKNVEYDLNLDRMTIQSEGVWMLTINMTLSFTEAQGDRALHTRLLNTDTLTPSPEAQHFVGRNTSGYTVNFSTLIAVDPTAVGDVFEFQVSSQTDTFTTVQVESSTWSLSHSSEYKGELP